MLSQWLCQASSRHAAQMKCSTRILIPYAHQVFLEFNFIYIATVLNNAHPIILERVAQTLVRKHLVKVWRKNPGSHNQLEVRGNWRDQRETGEKQGWIVRLSVGRSVRWSATGRRLFSQDSFTSPTCSCVLLLQLHCTRLRLSLFRLKNRQVLLS